MKPILYSTPMVRAILNNTKTMTRRIVKGTALWFLNEGFSTEFVTDPHNSFCPYGKPGDLLWVRETFYEHIYHKKNYRYESDFPEGFTNGSTHWKKKPSIFMPKDACRIFLRIKSVSIERLQDISEEDAKSEGVERWIETRLKSKPTRYKVYCDVDNPEDPALYSSAAYDSFQTLWHKLHGKESWDLNPWVWAITFSRTHKPITK